MKKKLIPFVFVLSTLSLNAYDVDINGFISASGGKSDNKETDVAGYENTKAPLQSSNADSVKFQPDSLMGLQLSSSVSDNFSATLQLVGQFENDKANVSVEWAYITYSIEHLQVQIGRYRPAVYMYSNTYNVAHSYLWTRLPIEVYYTVPITNLDGINLLYSYEFDNEMVFNAKVYYGNRHTIIKLQNVDYEVSFDDVYGTELSIENDYIKIRAAYAHTTLSAILGKTTIPGTNFELNLDTYNGLKIDDNNANFYSLGLNVEYSNMILTSEIIHTSLEPSATEEQIDSYYVLFGYNIDNFTPSITYASKIAKYTHNTNVLAKQIKGNEPDQRSITTGIRYDINPSTAIKAEWMRTDQKYLENQVSNSVTNLYTLSLNLVF